MYSWEEGGKSDISRPRRAGPLPTHSPSPNRQWDFSSHVTPARVIRHLGKIVCIDRNRADSEPYPITWPQHVFSVAAILWRKNRPPRRRHAWVVWLATPAPPRPGVREYRRVYAGRKASLPGSHTSGGLWGLNGSMLGADLKQAAIMDLAFDKKYKKELQCSLKRKLTHYVRVD